MSNRVCRAGWLAAVVVLAAGCAGAGGAAEDPRPDSVSIGYGTQAASSVTGAVQTIQIDSGQAHTGTTLELLEGRVAGLEIRRLPGGGVALRLRGTTSVNMTNEPLLVLDDVIVAPESVGNLLMTLPPNEVARIDVLKDAGATAIYGSRGANGVIVIHTKR